MKDHVSIRLETFGVRQTSAILSIGAVRFDPDTGALGETFYKEIDVASAIKSGTISADTLAWWITHPNAKARHVLFVNKADKVPLATALDEFARWIRAMPSPKVWGSQIAFEISMLEHAYLKGAVGLSEPWHGLNIRDTQTLLDVARYHDWPGQIPVNGSSATSLDRATTQAAVISACWRALRTGKIEKPAAASAKKFANDDEI